MSDSEYYYNEIVKILKQTDKKIKKAGIPYHEAIPVFADHIMFNVLAMGHSNNLSEVAAMAVIKRMENTLEDWRNGNFPFDDFNKNMNAENN